MKCTLGIDTSNYTTSAAIMTEAGEIRQAKRLLPVEPGKSGLRQSDAVFLHVRQLPDILEDLLADRNIEISAVGVSDRPRNQLGSYMPCFTVGAGFGRSLAAALRVPLRFTSHQVGHIAAALYSADVMNLFNENFLAFHVSGGTTEALYIRPDREKIFDVTVVGKTLDLKAGQAIDRVGGVLGLGFPAGPELEKLALQWEDRLTPSVFMRGTDFSLSGVENRCERMLKNGESPAKVARYCLCHILKALDLQAEVLIAKYGNLPMVFAGGVMSNGIIRNYLREKYGAYFAEPEFSCDNAAGVAIAAKLKLEKSNG